MKIFKYEIEMQSVELVIKDEQKIVMPRGAMVLHVGMQNGRICLWAQVNPDDEPMERRFIIHGTCHENLPEATPLTHIATVMDGSFVWHVFDPLTHYSKQEHK